MSQINQNVVPTFLRVPVWHPDYAYPPSKNPYATKVRELQGLIYSDHETERSRGSWRETFAESLRANPELELDVELGCNAGHVILEWAQREPGRAFVGLDWKYKPVHRAGEKTVKRGLSNVKFFRAHAERLRFIFGESEVDRLFLFFPDPWPRKSQWKNRFVRPDRLRDAWSVLKPGGLFHIKTDHAGYFDWIEESLGQVPDLFEVSERTRDLHADNPRAHELTMPEVTLFERLFIKDGLPIHSLKLLARK